MGIICLWVSRVIPSYVGINDLDLQFAAAGYFDPDVSAFTIGFESSELYISSVFQGESVGSLRADLGKVITSSPPCFHSPASTVALLLWASAFCLTDQEPALVIAGLSASSGWVTQATRSPFLDYFRW